MVAPREREFGISGSHASSEKNVNLFGIQRDDRRMGQKFLPQDRDALPCEQACVAAGRSDRRVDDERDVGVLHHESCNGADVGSMAERAHFDRPHSLVRDHLLDLRRHLRCRHRAGSAESRGRLHRQHCNGRAAEDSGRGEGAQIRSNASAPTGVEPPDGESAGERRRHRRGSWPSRPLSSSVELVQRR